MPSERARDFSRASKAMRNADAVPYLEGVFIFFLPSHPTAKPESQPTASPSQ